MPTDREIRVSVYSSDIPWMLQLAEICGDFNHATYPSSSAAFAMADTGEAGVIVVGPANTDEVLEAMPRLRSARVSVVLVVEEATVGLLRDAMIAGVGDVIETSKLDDLPGAIRSQDERMRRLLALDDEVVKKPGAGRVVIVTAAKGGQGATTVASNLAISLQAHGPTVLVEGDPRYGDLLAAFGYRQSRTELVPAADVLPDHWIGRYLYRHPSGIVLAIPRPDTTPETFGPDAALEALDAVQQVFDHVVIDLPLWAHEQYRVRGADDVLMVSTDRLRDLGHAKSAVAELALDTRTTHLVVSTYLDGRTPKRTDMLTMTGLATLGRIPETPDAEKALLKGEPLVIGKSKGPQSIAFGELSDALVALLPSV